MNEVIAGVARLVVRLLLVAAGVVFFLSLLAAMLVLALVWGLRYLWARLTGRLRPMADEGGGSVLILRPARREMVPPRTALEKLRRHAAVLTPLLDDLSCPLPPAVNAVIRSEGQGLAAALPASTAALTAPTSPRTITVTRPEPIFS